MTGQTTPSRALRDLLAAWRWASQAGHGGAAGLIRVRDAAERHAYARAAAEAERTAPEGNEALLALASLWRERCLGGWLPDDLPLPQLPPGPPGRPGPDPVALRREQQIGYALALASCAAQLHEAAGGEV